MPRNPIIVSKIMASIKSSDTSIEKDLRRALWHHGLRFRKNYSALDGKPDIVFSRQKVAIFCDSDFWHGRNWVKLKKRLVTNRDYWVKKISGNIRRDKLVNRKLQKMGWTVIRFWENDIRQNLEVCVRTISLALKRKTQG